jgi:hypothetical protein
MIDVLATPLEQAQIVAGQATRDHHVAPNWALGEVRRP